MTKFIYIADTHLGANPMGYQQQKGYPGRLTEILSALQDFISKEDDISFILHGGDMLDSTSDLNILAAREAFKLTVPVHLCLGNHDLTSTDSVGSWMELAPEFFMSGKPDFTIATADCVIHVVPNHWCETPFYWKEEQDAHFSAAQTELLSQELEIGKELPHIVLTHSPVYGLPVEQTGLTEEFHSPNISFTEGVGALLERHPGVRCVLGAHNHMNMRVARQGVEFATASALVETPFEFKLFEVAPYFMKMSTFSLKESLGFGEAYDSTRKFVQGRETDRGFSCRF